MPTRIYHWKHGWIPLDHVAALSKAHGSHKGAARELAKSHAAGHAHHSALVEGAHTNGTHVRGLQPVSDKHLPRARSIIAAHDPQTRNFHLLQTAHTGPSRATVIPEALGEHLNARGHHISMILDNHDGTHSIVVQTPEGGLKTFRSDGTDRLVVDPDKAELKKTIERYAKSVEDARPPAPTRPEWARKHDEVAARLTKDRASIGYRQETQTADAQRQEHLDAAVARAGGTLEELDVKIKGAQANIRNWDALIVAADDHPGIYSAKTWPPELAQLAKDSGLSRRMPKNALPPLLRARREQEQAMHRMSIERQMLERNIHHLTYERDFKDKVRRVEDLTPTGELGAESAAALKTIHEAGRILDEQVEKRVAARLGDRPDPRPQLAELQDKIDAILEARHHAYLAGDDHGYDSYAPELESLRRKRTALTVSLSHYRTDRNKVYAEEARAALAELRPLGGKGLDYVEGRRGADFAPGRGSVVFEASHADLVARMRKAEANYPAAWLDRAREENPKVALILTGRGYNSMGKLIALSGPPDGNAAVHELGHSMELAVPGLSGLEWAYHYHRSSSVKAGGRRSLDTPEELMGMPGEYSYKDQWAHAYTGKKYANNGQHGQYEIFTMGAESLFAGSNHFDRETQNGIPDVDVEYRQFMLGALSVL